MTTIVWDGKTLCADSLLSDTGGMRCGEIPKIVHSRYRKKPALIGVTGSYSAAFRAVLWLEGKVKEKPEFTEDFELLIVQADMTSFVGRDLSPYPAPTPCELGSGAPKALDALTLGLNAREAVELAIKLDCMSGGTIVEKTLED